MMLLLIRKSEDFSQTFKFCRRKNYLSVRKVPGEAKHRELFFWGHRGLCYWKDKELQADHKITTKKTPATQRDKIGHPRALLYLFHMSSRNLKDILCFNAKKKSQRQSLLRIR